MHTKRKAAHSRGERRINRVSRRPAPPASTDLFEYRQLVAVEGYKWITAPRDERGPVEQWLTDKALLPPGLAGYGGHEQLGRAYSPFTDKPALFREFAALAPTPAAFLVFANDHGPLGHERRTLTVTGPNEARWEVEAEPLSAWRDAHRRLARAVAIWDLTERRDVAGLKRWIAWGFGTTFGVADTSGANVKQLEYWVHGQQSWEDAHRPLTPQVADGTIGDFVAAGQRFVQEEVNKHLTSRHEHTVALLSFDRNRGRLTLRLRPPTLFGALWLQLARAVAGHITYRQCAHKGCDKWLEISTDPSEKAYRTNREYCSTACRIREFRRKHKNRE
jgi:hypothetical protein